MLFKQLIAINSSNSNNQFMYETIQSTFFKKKKEKEDIWCKRNGQVLLQSPEIMKFGRKECKKAASSYEKKESSDIK